MQEWRNDPMFKKWTTWIDLESVKSLWNLHIGRHEIKELPKEKYFFKLALNYFLKWNTWRTRWRRALMSSTLASIECAVSLQKPLTSSRWLSDQVSLKDWTVFPADTNRNFRFLKNIWNFVLFHSKLNKGINQN